MDSNSATPKKEKIVVGVDGSAGSIDALTWATQEAKLRDATLHVVTAWEFPYLYAAGSTAMLLPLDQLEVEAKSTLDKAIETGISDPEVRRTVQREVFSGNPAAVLRDLSEDADLIVVGARGHGGFFGLLLGSVSDQLVKHAACPVVVIRHKNADTENQTAENQTAEKDNTKNKDLKGTAKK
jgi:nucleotide-binding universal stress UspA family protein